MSRPWIMVAGPYTSGGADAAQRAGNLRAMNRAAVLVFRKGYMPLIGVNMALPMIEAEGAQSFADLMMPVSLELSERCDSVLRIGGPSEGADAEMTRFIERGLPVYRDIAELPEVHP